MKLICPKCKKEFEGRKRRKFCSSGCATSYRNLGKKHPEKTRKNISEALQGNKNTLGKHWKLSEEMKRKMSEANMGEKNPNFGKGEKIKGEKNPNWRNGISKEPYSFDFTKELKEEIRKRDNYICQLCNKMQEEELKNIRRKLTIHHIDYNKKNNQKINLITLCVKCNAIVNYDRLDWINYFKKKL